jgi:hypothetical protein
MAVPAPLPPEVTVIKVGLEEVPVTVGVGVPEAVTVKLELPVVTHAEPFQV